MNYTFASFAFGCRVNQAEKEHMDNKLEMSGYIYNADNPDFYIINSCAVTGKAEHEVRQYIHHIRRIFPCTTIIVTGCAATRWKKDTQTVSGVDILIDNAHKYEIDTILATKRPRVNQKVGQKIRQYSDKFTESCRVMIKLQDGCSRFCSYCIVPYLRGKPITRSIDEIVYEIKQVEETTSEVILTAINTEYFGIGNDESIPKLMDMLFHKTKIPRFSFGSIHPWSLNSEFISWYKDHAHDPRLIHFFHVPIQSGSNSVLQRMNRGYQIEDILGKFKILKTMNNELLIGTDIIVGYLGETDAEFTTTLTVLKDSPISRFHVFRFSPRVYTQAHNMRSEYPDIKPNVAFERSRSLLTLSKKKYASFQKQMIGTKQSVLFLKETKAKTQRALLTNQVEVSVTVNEYIRPGTIRDVVIADMSNGMLIATLAEHR